MPEIRTQVERLATLMAESTMLRLFGSINPNHTRSSRETICFDAPSHVEAIEKTQIGVIHLALA